jgi:MoaA/NifB/PqqE/SkfB family radical SAM enzyme
MSVPFVDGFGRRVKYLRLSVTDRCDLRCRYCMSEAMTFQNPDLPRRPSIRNGGGALRHLLSDPRKATVINFGFVALLLAYRPRRFF